MDVLDTIFSYAFFIIGAIYFLHMGLYVVGANIYDIKYMKRTKHLPKRLWRKQPLVTVIVPAHNEEKVIVRCLESLRHSSYKNIEVFVHNDKSSDATRALVEAYQVQYPKFTLTLINRRKQVGKGGGVSYVAKRLARGEFVMTLDSDCVLAPDAIRNAVSYFRDKKVVGVAANVRIMDSATILGLVQKFEHMIGYKSKKFYTVTNSEFVIGGVASTYRRSIMKYVDFYDTDTQTEDIGLSMKIVALGNLEHKIVYAADVVASTEGVQTFKQLLKQRYRWKLGMMQNLLKYKFMTGRRQGKYSRMLAYYRMPMAFFSEALLLFEPLLLLYGVYLSIVYKTTALFVGAYLTITVYVLWTIWPDEHSSWKRKVALSSYSPVMYFLFYIMNVVQLSAIIRCIVHRDQVFLRIATDSKWVSPDRAGGVATS